MDGRDEPGHDSEGNYFPASRAFLTSVASHTIRLVMGNGLPEFTVLLPVFPVGTVTPAG